MADERAYAEQTEAITRMRGLLEDENEQKRQQALKEMQAYNKRLALEKKMREEAWRQDQARKNASEVTLTLHHEQLDKTGKITRMQ